MRVVETEELLDFARSPSPIRAPGGSARQVDRIPMGGVGSHQSSHSIYILSYYNNIGY